MNTITVSAFAAATEDVRAWILAHGVAIVADAQVSAPVDLEAPALEVPAQDAPTEELLPVLTRAAWKTLRTTRKGTVRKAFAGLTREQAFEAGLCEGFRMPEGTMRAHLASLKDA